MNQSIIRPSLTFEKFLEVLLPGIIVVVGTWYLHRPLITKYFPLISSSFTKAGISSSGVSLRLLTVLLGSIVVGLIINHLADIAIVGIIQDDANTEKSKRKSRGLLRILFSIFTFKPADDPRKLAINRYLNSKRKNRFLEMMENWAGVSEEDLYSQEELVPAHQHIVARMKVLSDGTRSLVQELFSHTMHSAALFLALVFLLLINFLSYLTAYSLSGDTIVHSYSSLLMSSFIIYCGTVISCYALKRRFRHFCSQVITLGLHAHHQEKATLESKEDRF
jgi:hypothetical protein